MRLLNAPGDLVFTSHHTIGLNPAIATDVEVFRDLVQTASGEADPERQAELLQDARGIYGHGLLPAFAEPWLSDQRGALAGLFGDAEGRLVNYAAEAAIVVPVPLASPEIHERPIKPGSPGTSDIRDRHVARVAAFATVAGPRLRGPESRKWLGRVEAEIGSITLALRWACDTGDREAALRIAGGLWRYWFLGNKIDEGRRYIEQALATG